MITSEQKHRAEMLRTAMNAIKLDADGLAAGCLSPAEASVTAKLCREIEEFTSDDGDAYAQPWRRAAAATVQLINCERGPSVVDAWVSARAQLPLI